jgi:hypothetical protein
MTNGNRILASLGVLVLCSVFSASQALGADVTIGGKVLTLENPPVAVVGATVSVYPAGTPNTTTAGDGSWSLTVSDASDPVLKIDATATTVVTYTEFPLSLLMGYQSGPYEYDISAVLPSAMATVPAGSCLVVGFALQYTSLGYPVTQTFLPGVVVTPTPAAYVAANGVDPCLVCTATTASGAWVGTHVAPYSTAYSGVIPDSGGSCAGAAAAVVLTGGDVTCVADSANVTGLIHPSLP